LSLSQESGGAAARWDPAALPRVARVVLVPLLARAVRLGRARPSPNPILQVREQDELEALTRIGEERG
jgi:hypothetical protein